MGMTYIEGVASGIDDQRVTVRFLVDMRFLLPLTSFILLLRADPPDGWNG